MKALTTNDVTALILAGGQGRRMDAQDKGLVRYIQRSLIESVIQAIGPQTQQIVIFANRNIERNSAYHYPVLSEG